MTETWSVSPSVDMLTFGVTIPATVPQRSEIPEGLMNYSIYTATIIRKYRKMKLLWIKDVEGEGYVVAQLVEVLC